MRGNAEEDNLKFPPSSIVEQTIPTSWQSFWICIVFFFERDLYSVLHGCGSDCIDSFHVVLR